MNPISLNQCIAGACNLIFKIANQGDLLFSLQ